MDPGRERPPRPRRGRSRESRSVLDARSRTPSARRDMTTPICRCRVIYLGSSVPHTTKDGLQGIQEPLRDLYPESGLLSSETPSIGIDSWLSVWSNGILIENVDDSGREVKRFFPIESLHYCAAVRYVVIPGSTGSSSNDKGPSASSVNDGGSSIEEEDKEGKYTTISGLNDRIKFLPLDSPFSRNSNITVHPPLFACILRRTSGIKVLECHAFICKRDQAANALVRCCFHAYADSMHAKQMVEGAPEGRGPNGDSQSVIEGPNGGRMHRRYSRSISDLDSVDNKIQAWRIRSTEALDEIEVHDDDRRKESNYKVWAQGQEPMYGPGGSRSLLIPVDGRATMRSSRTTASQPMMFRPPSSRSMVNLREPFLVGPPPHLHHPGHMSNPAIMMPPHLNQLHPHHPHPPHMMPVPFNTLSKKERKLLKDSIKKMKKNQKHMKGHPQVPPPEMMMHPSFIGPNGPQPFFVPGHPHGPPPHPHHIHHHPHPMMQGPPPPPGSVHPIYGVIGPRIIHGPPPIGYMEEPIYMTHQMRPVTPGSIHPSMHQQSIYESRMAMNERRQQEEDIYQEREIYDTMNGNQQPSPKNHPMNGPMPNGHMNGMMGRNGVSDQESSISDNRNGPPNGNARRNSASTNKNSISEDPSDSDVTTGIYKKKPNINERAFSYSIRQESRSRSGSVANISLPPMEELMPGPGPNRPPSGHSSRMTGPMPSAGPSSGPIPMMRVPNGPGPKSHASYELDERLLAQSMDNLVMNGGGPYRGHPSRQQQFVYSMDGPILDPRDPRSRPMIMPRYGTIGGAKLSTSMTSLPLHQPQYATANGKTASIKRGSGISLMNGVNSNGIYGQIRPGMHPHPQSKMAPIPMPPPLPPVNHLRNGGY